MLWEGALNELQKLKGDLVQEKKKVTFAQRVAQKQHRDPLLILIKEIRQLSESNFFQNLSPQDAAQRLAIGTVVGKFHQDAVKIRGITVEDYQKDRDAFIELLEQTKITPNDTEKSVISLQNQKDIFLEDDLIQGLQMCSPQYDLVTALLLIGYGVNIKRNDGQ